MITSFCLFLMILLAGGAGSCNAASQEAGPSLFLDAKELARLQSEIRRLDWKRAAYEGEDADSDHAFAGTGVRSGADLWMKRKIEIPARSGHYHHFFCECGSRLTFPTDGREHPEGYPCSACGKVYAGEKYDGAVRWQIHNQLAVAALNMGIVSAVEGKREYARKAGEILLKYAAAYPGPHTTQTQGGMMYQSLCEAVWSIELAAAYDFARSAGVLSKRETELIENRLLRPIGEGLMSLNVRGNWHSWHLSAVGVIGYAIGDSRLVDYALAEFRRQISEELGDDGLWPESVHTYHFYPLGAFLYLAEAAYHHGVDLYHLEPKPGKSLKAMFTAPLGYMYPDTRLPAIHDGWYNSFLPANHYELAWARIGDPAIGWGLKEACGRQKTARNSFWALLQGRPLPRTAAAPGVKSVNFPVLGIAALRSRDGAMMTLDYGPFMGHGQFDKMGVTLFALGKLWSADYGTPGYGSPIMPWYTGTPGHNTVVVDGKNQARTQERRLTIFAAGETFEAAQAETEEAYPGVLQRRSVIRVGERFVLVDHLQSAEEHTYDWFLRSEGALTLEKLPEAEDAPALEYAHVTDAKAYGAASSWAGQWRQGRLALDVCAFSSAPATLYSARCPAETANRTVPLAMARARAKTLDIVTVLAPRSGGAQAACSFENGVLTIRDGEAVDYVAIGSTKAGAELAADAAFALVRTSDGKTPTLAGVIEGAKVTWKGRSLIASGSRQTALEVEAR